MIDINLIRETPKVIKENIKKKGQDNKLPLVDEAIKLGADGISLHINVGGSLKEPDMLAKLGHIAEECDSWEMPLLAMMYPRGKNISNPIDTKQVELVTRVGAELGADIVKSVYTGDVESFSKVVEKDNSGCLTGISFSFLME